MKKRVGIIKRVLCIGLIFLLSINSFAAIVSDNDGSAFITKAEFDALKSSFQSQIDSYNNSIDSKIDGAIASYLAGIKLSNIISADLLFTRNGLGSETKLVSVNDTYHNRTIGCQPGYNLSAYFEAWNGSGHPNQYPIGQDPSTATPTVNREEVSNFSFFAMPFGDCVGVGTGLETDITDTSVIKHYYKTYYLKCNVAAMVYANSGCCGLLARSTWANLGGATKINETILLPPVNDRNFDQSIYIAGNSAIFSDGSKNPAGFSKDLTPVGLGASVRLESTTLYYRPFGNLSDPFSSKSGTDMADKAWNVTSSLNVQHLKSDEDLNVYLYNKCNVDNIMPVKEGEESIETYVDTVPGYNGSKTQFSMYAKPAGKPSLGKGSGDAFAANALITTSGVLNELGTGQTAVDRGLGTIRWITDCIRLKLARSDADNQKLSTYKNGLVADFGGSDFLYFYQGLPLIQLSKKGQLSFDVKMDGTSTDKFDFYIKKTPFDNVLNSTYDSGTNDIVVPKSGTNYTISGKHAVIKGNTLTTINLDELDQDTKLYIRWNKNGEDYGGTLSVLNNGQLLIEN